MVDPVVQLTIAIGLALLFAAAAAHKLSAWDEWPGVVRNYRIVPESTVGTAVILLPALEVAAAAALLSPARAAGAVLAAVLLSAYATALGINLVRGRTSIDCGCFGPRLRQGISRWMVVRNGVLAVLALAVMLPTVPRPVSLAELALAAGFAATAAFLYPVLPVVFRAAPRTFDENYRASLAARASR